MQISSKAARSERLLPAREVYATRLGISHWTFYDLISKGEFPAAVSTRQRVGWRESAVNDWILSRPRADAET